MAVSSSEVEPAASGSGRRLLVAVKILLALLLAGLVLARHNDNTWPLVSWPMFDSSGKRPPSEQRTSYRIRVIDIDGHRYELTPEQLATGLPGVTADEIVSKSFYNGTKPSQIRAAQAGRAGLVSLIGRNLPRITIARIEGWELTWLVHPDQSPPIDVGAPIEQTLLGAFSPSELEPAS